MLRIFFALKIRWVRPGVNLPTWVPKASTLPLEHRRRYKAVDCENWIQYRCIYIHIFFIYITFITVSNTAVCVDHLEKSKLYVVGLERLGTVWNFAYRPRLVRCPTIRGITDNLQRKSNKMQQCIKILFQIYIKLKMFLATHLPSSGA